METVIDQDLIAAQAKLEQKRAALNRTKNRGRKIESIDEPLVKVIERCKEKSQECGPICDGPIPKVYNYPEYNVKDNEIAYLKYIGVSLLYRDCSFENYIGNNKLVDDLMKIKEEKQSVILRGNTGCGKTHLAVAMVRTDGYNARFITVPDLLLKIRSSFNGGQETEEEIINNYSEIETLVLDDLGAEKTSEFAITTLYIILDRRLRECRQTIITTNLSQKEIEETFGARIASRLAGMVNIKINMPDYRKKRGQ